MKTLFNKLTLVTLLLAAPAIAWAENVKVINPPDDPVQVEIVAGASSGGGDASAANQTAVQATAGSDASKATAVQGITGGKAVATSSSNLPTTVDTNSGSKSASTVRVVLATDQPALTNKILVTPDSVALPANQSVNVAQINGVTPLMGSGNTGTGSPRVTLATDQANLTTPLNVKQAVRATWVTGQVTTSNIAGTLVGANSTRRRCLIKNTDTSITVAIGPATVSMTTGMLLKAGESMEVTATALIQVIAASGSPVVVYSDESD